MAGPTIEERKRAFEAYYKERGEWPYHILMGIIQGTVELEVVSPEEKIERINVALQAFDQVKSKHYNEYLEGRGRH